MKPRIGKYCTIADDVVFGDDVVVHGHANLYGCRIGDQTRIGTFVEIQAFVDIGKRVRIQSHTFVCSHVVMEDDVFVGHNVNFINDRYPTAQKAADKEWKNEPIRVCKGSSIGTGAIILCGTTIGEGAVIAAGSVITRDVEPHTVVAGNPAKLLRTLSSDERWRGGERSGRNVIKMRAKNIPRKPRRSL
jgi:acetyltransferase-like isoleucine patch superfamily enzyme